MTAPDPHKPPPPPPWATPWHTPTIERCTFETPVAHPPPVPMVIAIAAACLALGIIIGRAF